MQYGTKKLLSCFRANIGRVIFLTLAFWHIPIQAHEERIIVGGAIEIVVGNNPEPIFEDQIYHTDLFLTKLDKGEELPVNVEEGAELNLDVYIFLLEDDVFIGSLEELEAQALLIEKIPAKLEQRFGEVNRYGIPYRPTHDGAYGFRYVGTITTNDGMEFEIDEIFVCGEGHAPDVDGGFACVSDVWTFPGNPGDHDRSGYRDNDVFSLEP